MFHTRKPLAFDVGLHLDRPRTLVGTLLLRRDEDVFRHRSRDVHHRTTVSRISTGHPNENRRDRHRRPRTAGVREYGPTDVSRAKHRGTLVADYAVLVYFDLLIYLTTSRTEIYTIQ